MASRFDEDFMRGYKHAPFFDKWAERVRPVLGNIIQCGVMEFHKSGKILVAANREDIGEDALQNQVYKHQKLWCHKEGLLESEFDAGSYWYYRKLGLFKSKFDIFHFSQRGIVDSNTQKLMFFCSDEPKIYGELMQNYSLVKKMFDHFFIESNAIAEQCREHMVDMSNLAQNYFVKFNPNEDSDLGRLNNLLQEINVLGSEKVTAREWQCAMLYSHGKSARETGEILGISRRTVETHFVNLKEKLGVAYKSEILDKLT